MVQDEYINNCMKGQTLKLHNNASRDACVFSVSLLKFRFCASFLVHPFQNRTGESEGEGHMDVFNIDSSSLSLSLSLSLSRMQALFLSPLLART
jgi:hypothetical protein